MNVKKRTFMGGFVGVLMISTVLLCSMGYGETIEKEYDATERLKREVIYQGKVTREGTVKDFDKDGKLRSEGIWKNGMPISPVKQYDADGKLRSEAFWRDGKIVKGTLKVYDEKQGPEAVNRTPSLPAGKKMPDTQGQAEAWS
ncbi:MAG: hypothetical protein ABH891_00790 [Candidatus Omnitrophota bacterium]